MTVRPGPSGNEPFARSIGLAVTACGETRLTIRPELVNGVGMLLGPVVFALVDYAMGDAIWQQLEPGLAGVTVNIAVNFVDSVGEGEVVCAAHVTRRGRRLASTAAEVRGPGDVLMATAIGTFAIRPISPAADPR
jgi:acyl-CoA thioesterase